MIILEILVNIIFYFSIGSIFALLIAHSAVEKDEIIEIDGILHVGEEKIELNEYYRLAGWSSWVRLDKRFS